MTSERRAAGNDLLSSLRPSDRELLLASVSECRLAQGAVIHLPGQPVDHCYFPREGAISSYQVRGDGGERIETVMIGREGALGGIVSHGSLPAFACANVLHEGDFLRISLADLEKAKAKSPAIGHLFMCYADCLMAQVFQSIACNALHSIEQRAAKWLLAAVDRVGKSSITMTQEQLASMMGIGRSYASRVVQRFKLDGLVRTRRGGIEVIDQDGLHARACNCNDLVRDHFEAVLAGVYPG